MGVDEGEVMANEDLGLVQTSDLINELLGRYQHAVFAGIALMTTDGDFGVQHIRRKWKGNNVTCQGLCWTLANACDGDLNETSEPLED